MLQVVVPASELYDERSNEFFETKRTVLRLEHSLVSVSKWESEHKKPFMTDKGLTASEFRDYIRCMTLTQNVDPFVYEVLPSKIVEEIREYVDSDRTATWFSNCGNTPPSRETVTSEVIYYWMTVYGIPFEAQKWHLSRLLTLIRICGVKSDNRKMSREATMRQNRALNAARRKRTGSKG